LIQGTVAARFLKAFVVEKYYLGVKWLKQPLNAEGAGGSRRTLRRAKLKEKCKTKGAGRIGAGPFTSREVNL
jgi:hypothetical protein